MGTRRAFILGAGFSKQAGMPLATDLTDYLLEKFKEYKQKDAITWFAWLKERANWIESNRVGISSLLNIEQIFDLAWFDAELWRMEQQRCSLGRTAGDVPWQVAENIDAWLRQMEEDLRDVIWKNQKKASKNLQHIANFSQQLWENDAVLTFNYDTLLEKSLTNQNKVWQYGLPQENGSGVKILKMHGSINWFIVPRNQCENFDYQLLFRKEDLNVTKHKAPSPDEIEWKYELIKVPDSSLPNRIENRMLQHESKQYVIGIAGLGSYKPISKLPGSGKVWHNAGRALYQADEIYIIGFSLSPFDSMARLHFSGVMLERSEKGNPPKKIILIDPNACELKVRFSSIFGQDTPIEIINKRAEQVDWSVFLR